MKSYSLLRVIPTALITVTIIAAGSVYGIQQSRQKRLSYDEINNRIVILQARADSLSAVLEQLRQDSASTAREQTRQNAGQAKKQADIEDALTKKRALASAARNQYEKAKADSTTLVAKNRDQIAALHKELLQAEASSAALNNELALLIDHQDRLGTSSAGADEKTLARLQTQLTKNDSLVRMRQSDIANLNTRRDKLRQDSVQAEAKRAGAASQVHQQIVRLDSLIATDDALIAQIEQKQTGERSEKEQKSAQVQQNITLFTKQKQSATDQINRANVELSVLTGERDRLVQSSGSARTKYDALRLPYENAFAGADTLLQAATKDKTVLLALRDKVKLDSVIFKARDELDHAIQAEAEKKKGGKKLVEQRENDLDALLQKQDSILRATPGLRARESQFRSSTTSQKIGLVDSAVSLSDKKIAAAAAQRDKTKQNLAAFIQKNPEPQNTASMRLTQLDTLIATKKKEIIGLTSAGDSLNILLQDLQTSVSSLSTKGKGESGKTDSTLQNKKNDKQSLTAKRTKIQRDSAQNDAAEAASLLRTKSELFFAANQLLIAQNEATTLAAERDKTKLAIAATQEKARQSQSSIASEKRKTDSLASAKQEEIMLLSAKIEKHRKDSSDIIKQQEQQLKGLSPSPSSLAGLMATLDKEVLALQAQRDSLTRATLAGPSHGGDAGKKSALQIASVNRSIESVQNDIATLNAQKEEAAARLKGDKAAVDSSITAAEQELAACIARRDKSRQDSIAAETGVHQSSIKAASIIRMHDSIIAVRQKELAEATADYNRLLDDGTRSSEKTQGSLQGYSQTIKSIDAEIAAKEREIADLRLKKDKEKQDSIAEFKRQAGLTASVHAEIAKHNAAVEQKKVEIALAISEKKKAQADTGSIQKKSMEAVGVATAEILRQTDLIGNKQTELARLQKERDTIAARIRATSEKRSGVITTDEPSTTTPAAAAPTKTLSPAELAQKKSEEIYALLGENKVAEASKKFKSLQQFFKMNLDADSFQALKTTIEQMGGGVK
jgi:hypothetical protein